MHFSVNLLTKVYAGIMLAIFCAVPIIEAFHRHHTEVNTEVVKDYSKGQQNKQVVHAKCTVCDFVYHKFSKTFHTFNSTEETLLTEVDVVNQVLALTAANAGYVHLSGNKGPPIVA